MSAVRCSVALSCRNAAASYRVDLGSECIQIDKEIDSSISECGHALLVITSRVNMVDTNGIGAKLLHQSRVEFALSDIDQRIIRNQLMDIIVSIYNRTRRILYVVHT